MTSARQADMTAAAAVAGTGHGARVSWAPGRCTIIGEHVDYAGGRVLSCAVELGVAAAVVNSPDGRWRVRSGERQAERSGQPAMRGDIADRPLAAAVAAADAGIAVPAQHISVAASLPQGAGLSSSAALICATLGSLLSAADRRMAPRDFVEAAWRAEHEVAGIACGRLDHHAVVEAPPGGVLDLDCATGEALARPWPWADVVLVVVDSGQSHDVADPRYTTLRRDAEDVLAELGRSSCSQVAAADLERISSRLRSRALHLHNESRRVEAAAAALVAGDEMALGREMSAAHGDLRDLLRTSVPPVERLVEAARGVSGCFGARMVGAGFGGSVVALCRAGAAADCVRAMVARVQGSRWVWTGAPAAGMAALSPEVFAAAATPNPPPGP